MCSMMQGSHSAHDTYTNIHSLIMRVEETQVSGDQREAPHYPDTKDSQCSTMKSNRYGAYDSDDEMLLQMGMEGVGLLFALPELDSEAVHAHHQSYCFS